MAQTHAGQGIKMKKFIKNCWYCLVFFQKETLGKLLEKIPFIQGNILEYLFKKYSGHFLIILGLIFLSLISEFLPAMLKEKPKPLSLDSLVPKDFVLMPIEISNGKDIMNIIGKYGVVDLYAYSKQTGLPEKQAASALKILPPDAEEGHFVALVPEKEATYLFGYSDPFYAVIQNPNKKGAKIYKKKKKQSLIVIEEVF